MGSIPKLYDETIKTIASGIEDVSRIPTTEEVTELEQVVGLGFHEKLSANGFKLLVAVPTEDSSLYQCEDTRYMVQIADRIVYFTVDQVEPDKVHMGFSFVSDDIAIKW